VSPCHCATCETSGAPSGYSEGRESDSKGGASGNVSGFSLERDLTRRADEAVIVLSLSLSSRSTLHVVDYSTRPFRKKRASHWHFSRSCPHAGSDSLPKTTNPERKRSEWMKRWMGLLMNEFTTALLSRVDANNDDDDDDDGDEGDDDGARFFLSFLLLVVKSPSIRCYITRCTSDVFPDEREGTTRAFIRYLACPESPKLSNANIRSLTNAIDKRQRVSQSWSWRCFPGFVAEYPPRRDAAVVFTLIFRASSLLPDSQTRSPVRVSSRENAIRVRWKARLSCCRREDNRGGRAARALTLRRSCFIIARLG